MSEDRFGPPYADTDLRAEEAFREGEVTADMALVARWLSGELGPDERIAFEERLASDAAFLEFAAPLLVMHHARPPRHTTIDPERLIRLEASIERALADAPPDESHPPALTSAERSRRLRLVHGMTLQTLLLFAFLVATPIVLILYRSRWMAP